MDYSIDALVIGAGVIGLAVARTLAMNGLETIVVEQADAIGTQASSRNSEVIHAGIYYPHGSLKARLCVRGKALLYAYAAERNIPYRRCGKLILAVEEEERRGLARISQTAAAAGVIDLESLGTRDISALEPNASGIAGLFSPSTGIIDSHQMMLALQADLERSGGVIAFNSPVEGGILTTKSGAWHTVRVGGTDPISIGTRVLVNAAGLCAGTVWRTLGGVGHCGLSPGQYYAKGHYYSYSGEAPFSRPVYPLPQRGGLGVHATPDLAGQVRFGPDVCWIDTLDYGFDDSRHDAFVATIRRYYPHVDGERLTPGYTGIRAKLAGADAPASDFLILTPEVTRISGYVGLHGIESPGLTASLAIAEHVAQALGLTSAVT